MAALNFLLKCFTNVDIWSYTAHQKGLISPCTATRYLCRRMARRGSECTVRCRQAGSHIHAELYKDRNTIAQHNNFDGWLTCSGEERQDSKQSREGVGRSAEPHTALHCVDEKAAPRPSSEQQSASVCFFHANKGQRDSDQPPYIKLYPTVSCSSPWYLI